MMASISAVALLSGMTGCSTNAVPISSSTGNNSGTSTESTNSSTTGPDDPYCNEWEYDVSGIYECEDSDSDYYGYYFHKGTYHRDRSDIFYNKKSSPSIGTTSGSKSGTTSNSGTATNKNSTSNNTGTITNKNTTTNNGGTSKSTNSSSTSSNSQSTVSSSSDYESDSSTSSGFGSGTSTFGG